MIQVVERTFDILELLASKKSALSNTEIAAKMEISLQAANNLLRTIYKRGYISQDESRNYRLGTQCFYLGSFADRWGYIRERVVEPLRQLVEESSFTGFVGVIENDRLLCVATMNPKEKKLKTPSQNWWDELHSTACGRVLLASLPEKKRAKIFSRTTRKKLTDSTIVDINALEKICIKIAQDGYSEVRDESRAGASSLAIPLRDVSGKVFSGISISASNEKWEAISLEDKLDLLSKTVRKLEV